MSPSGATKRPGCGRRSPPSSFSLITSAPVGQQHRPAAGHAWPTSMTRRSFPNPTLRHHRPGARPGAGRPRRQGRRHPRPDLGRDRPGDIAIAGDRIVGTYESYYGATEIDGRGLIAVPGFIDTHVHCEITLVSPLGVRPLRRCRAAPRRRSAIRTRSATCWASEGLQYFLDSAAGHGDGPARAALVLRAGDRISRRRARGWRPPTWCRSRIIPR